MLVWVRVGGRIERFETVVFFCQRLWFCGGTRFISGA